MDIYAMCNDTKYTKVVRQNGAPKRPEWGSLEPLTVRRRRQIWAEYVRLLSAWQRQQEMGV